MKPDRIQLRAATSEDLEFLWRVMVEAMRPHVERTWGRWDEAFQRERFERSTDPTAQQIIELDGVAVGSQWVRHHPDAMELVRIYLLPEAQGRGIGTLLMRRLLDEARRAGQSLRLRVLKLNPAKDLYLRLGFTITGESETHYRMEVSWPEG
jgi:ribosomal protein S18 acetylase RimI-like enzyme